MRHAAWLGGNVRDWGTAYIDHGGSQSTIDERDHRKGLSSDGCRRWDGGRRGLGNGDDDVDCLGSMQLLHSDDFPMG